MHQTPNFRTRSAFWKQQWQLSVRGHLSEGQARSGIGPCEDPVQGTTRVSPSPDVAVAEAKKKVFRLEKALEAFGDSTGAEVDFLKKALDKAHEPARERPLEVQIKESTLEQGSWRH